MTTVIESTIATDPLSREIVLFLLENETAMDTTRGIANWWVRNDELAVQVALDRLITCGVITPHTFTSGTLYGLTRNPEIRAWLRATYDQTPKHARLAQGGDGKGRPTDGNRLPADNS